ncbi:MAG: F0F1 ATP synthase subunit A [Oscillospiraceae bacterium]|nr:F0F1 ATP synthase subunit A [Oscillospiraceae bacterium]
MELDIKNYAILRLGGIEIWITDTIVSTWIIMGVLIVFAIFVRIKIHKFKEIPTGFQNVVEALVEMFDNYLVSNVGPKLMYLGPWFFTVFAFVLLSNLSGIIPGLRPPTADWAMTLGIALVTFTLIQIMGFRYRKLAYLKSFVEPIFLFLPINLIGEIARPISLSFRLFGNILAGLVMMSLIYAMVPIVFKFVFPAALHAFFDIFAGALQAFIFTTLSMTFVANTAALSDE